MTSYKTKKLVGNPRHRKNKKKGRKGKRKLSPKQIRIFGSKAQKAALKRNRRAKRNTKHHTKKRRTKIKVHRPRKKSSSNPKRAARRRPRKHSTKRKIRATPRKANRKRKTKRARRARRKNPSLVFTLGSANPKRGRKTHVAKKRKKAKKSTRHNSRRRGRRNARRHVRVIHVSRRRRKNRKSSRRNSRRARRHNPALFGHHVSNFEMALAIGGGLVGVTVAKLVPPMLPANFTSNPWAKVAVTIGIAWAAGYGGRMLNANFGDAVFFGGLMQAGSLLLNALVPQLGAQFGLSGGVGELMPGQFAVPQNPLRLPAPPMAPAQSAQARIQMNGLQRAFGDAF